MTGAELKWAFLNGISVRILDRARGLDIWCRNIKEIVYRHSEDGVKVSAVCIDRIKESPSLVRSSASDVIFAKKEDEERCHRELSTQNAQVL